MTAHFAPPVVLEDDDLDLTLLDRYWSGETSAQESARVEAWFLAHPTWKARYDQMRREVVEDHWTDLTPTEVGHVVAKTLAYTTGRPTQQRHRPAWRSVYLIAASIVMAFVLVTGWQTGLRRANTRMAAYKSIYTTPNGQRANITLPDGTEVILNVGSRLEVPANFGLDTRTISLNGEAIFNVPHNTGKPFTVKAGPSETRVLGTRFAIRHYTTDTVATIAVENGKVSVGSTILNANEQFQIGARTITPIHRVSPTQFSFATGRLVISGKSLRNAIPDLERWYDADIHLATPALGDRRLTLESTSGTLVDLTAILDLALDLRVVREGRSITLYPR